MIKLAASSKIYFNHIEHGHMGWNHMANLLNPLGHRFIEKNPEAEDYEIGQFIADSLTKLQTKGYLTPDENLGESWWIVEKTIPFDIREAFRKDEISRDDVIKQLKV